MQILMVRWAALCFAAAFLPEVAASSLRARKGDDDGGDDGGGLGGALAGLFGGAGGGGGGGDDDDDDDDPNMVGGKGKHKKGGKHHKGGDDSGGGGGQGGVDLGGLEKGLAEGGVGQLTQMLTAMRAAQGAADTHIKKGPNGEDMYDFRDLDDGATTQMPITITVPPPTILQAAPQVTIPDMPTISMPGKGGKMDMKNMKRAEEKAAQDEKTRKQEEAEAKASAPKSKFVVWGATPPTAAPVVQAAPQAIPQQMAQAQPQTMMAPPMQQMAPMQQQQMAPMGQMPQMQQMAPMAQMYPMGQMGQMQQMAPMQAQMGQFGQPVANPLMQGLASMSQNMNMLMNMVQGQRMQSAQDTQTNLAPLNAKIDQMSQTFKEEEQKMEGQMENLETENKDMKTQLDDQAAEIQKLEGGEGKAKKAHHARKAKVQKAKAVPVQKAAPVEKAAPVKKAAPAPKAAPVVQQAAPVVQQAAPVVQKSAPVVQQAAPAVKVQEAKVATKVMLGKKSTKKGLKVKHSLKKASGYATAPWDATFKVHLNGKDKGKEDSFTVRVHPEWAPEGAKRFQDMVQSGILDEARFFRVVKGFMVQFGIPASPAVAKEWMSKRIKDDPVTQSNSRGMMTFATSGPNTRTTQMFVNYAQNDFLDKQGFAPFAEVIDDGMDVVDEIQSKYKEKPQQGKIQHHGNKYLMKHFPQLSSIGHIESTLTSSPAAVAGLIQDSESPVVAKLNKKYKIGGIATFYHQKAKVGA